MDKFSFDTIKNFDDHIRISIPDYNGLINHILNISTYFIKDDCLVYDFGCSTGQLIERLKDRNKIGAKYIGVDKSDNMKGDNEYIIVEDLRDFKVERHNFSLSIFTLQFLPICDRLGFLKKVYKNLTPGGAIIIAEKIFVDNGFLQDLYSFAYYDFKMKNFSADEIINKQLDLRYIMRPLTKKENIKYFKEAGFDKIELFWQSLLFSAWILIKD